MPCLGYIVETIRCRKLIFGRNISRGHGVTMASWCDLDVTIDLAYPMLFYLSTGISNTILYLLYLFT